MASADHSLQHQRDLLDQLATRLRGNPEVPEAEYLAIHYAIGYMDARIKTRSRTDGTDKQDLR